MSAIKNINAEKIQGNLAIESVSATTYYNLPTSGGSFTGGTVTGATIFTNGLTANTISATTYYNLPPDLWSQSGSSIYYNGGNVGIGTATPQVELHVKGDSSILRLETTSATNNNYVEFWDPTERKGFFGYVSTASIDSLFLRNEEHDAKIIISSTDSSGTSRTAINIDGNHDVQIPNGNFDVVGNTNIMGALNVNGDTTLNNITATTISATTYYNLPQSTDTFVTGGTYSTGTATFINNTGGTFSVTGFSTGTTTGNGTANYLSKWTGSTGQGNSQIRDDGTNISIGMAPDTNNKFSIITFSNNYYGLWVRNASSLSGAKGIYGLSNGNVGTQTGVWGVGEGHPTTGTSIGVDGGATDGLLGIGVRGIVGVSEFGSMVTGIGGYFDGRGIGEYGYPTNSYSLQLLDNTEGINKVLVSQTSDGKANWSSVLSGLTGVYTNTISATTYYNLPIDIFVTGGTYSTGTATFTNTTGGTFDVTGFYTGATDVFVTGGTYANGSLSFANNTGGTFTITTSTNYSAGIISGSTGWSSTGTGEINLPAIKVALYNNSNNIEPIIVYDVTSGTSGSGGITSLINNDTNYIVVEYNSGTPRYAVYNNDGLVDDSSVVLAYIVYRLNNFIHVLEFGNQGAGLANKLNDRIIMTDRFGWESGLTLGLSGTTGIVTLSAGVAWNGSYRQSLTAVNSQDDIFFKNFHSGGTWTYTTTGDTLNNTYYDDGTDIVVATSGTFLTNYYYRGQEVNDHLYEVYGTAQYDSVIEAEAATNPELPELISSHAFLVGRIIVEVGATTGITQTAFATVFSPSGYVPSAGEHNDLTGLQGGSAGQYYHLTSNEYNNNAYTNVDNNFSTGQTINGTVTVTDSVASNNNSITSDNLITMALLYLSNNT